jgi:outer membrane biosynthesis protein TonB
MYAELRSFSRPQRVAGAAATVITLALLAALLLRPMLQPLAEPPPETVTVAVLQPKVMPAVLPDIPLKNVELPIPLLVVNLPEFETPMVSTALPTLSPNTSPDAAPRASGGEPVSGTPEGTGRATGSGGSKLVPPVRRSSADAPFDLKQASRSGLVTSLNFCVTEAGRVTDVQLAATSGFDDTDKIAIDWMGRQRFTPGTLDGVRARMCATYDIRWTFSKAVEIERQDAARAHARTIRQRSRYPRQFVYWPEDRPFPGCDAVNVCRR